MSIFGLVVLIAVAGFVWAVAYPLGKQDGYHAGYVDASREVSCECLDTLHQLATGKPVKERHE
jgi:hypothetical protein